MKARFGARHVVAAVVAVVVAAGMVTPTLRQTALQAAGQVAGPGIAEAAVPPPPTTPDQATYEEKAKAFQTIGVLPIEEALELSDCPFVIELWRNMPPGTAVRAAAEVTFGGSDQACVQFIRFGLRGARDADQEEQGAKMAAALENRRVRQQAADTLGAVLTEEQLISGDRDVIHLLAQAVDPGIVREALLTAFGLDAADQRQFLLTGLYDAIKAQQVAAIEANTQKTDAEKAALIAAEARGAAAAELGVKAGEEVKAYNDLDFLSYIYAILKSRGEEGTEVYKDMVTAVFTLPPNGEAARAAFIKDGLRAAHQRDIDKGIAAQAAKDRATLTDIVTKAENSGVHPALVAAGRKALASTPAAIQTFIRVERWNHLEQSIRSMGRGRDMFVQDTDGGPTVRRRDPAGAPGTEKRMTWNLVPGLADGNCQTLESREKEGHYLAIAGNAQEGFASTVLPSDGSPDFDKRATWCTEKAHGGVKFVSASFGPLVLTFNNDHTITVGNHIEPNKGWSPTLWLIDGPGPNAVSAITHRWSNDEVVRTAVGNPMGPEVVEQRFRWRPYERGRLFWTQWSGATVVSEHLLPGLVRVLASDRAGLYGPSLQDDVIAPDGRGRYQVFAAGGGVYYNPDARQSYAVYGEIKKEWEKLGGLTGRLGYPTSDEFAINGNDRDRRSNFQHGWIEWANGVGNAYITG